MERVDILMVTMALTLLALVPKTESHVGAEGHVVPRPLCASQFALVNYACGRLPFSPGVPPAPVPAPPSPPSPDDERSHRHRQGHGGGGHGHGHRHRHHRESTPDEENCCRWAKDVDTQCVCELLVHLPPFLVKPAHQYTLIVGEECQITYSCGGPI
ncbi:uncharacterized protein LOC130725454 [Lotus japonicus]|uniref:uncharacterized protein LOC130725454 n=1 Tax=Lotus japonicus TaxID=34305 RepID=UPI00258A093C|nr:uncharacterized protein LOC130725454 [Lotus japonicus]